MFKGDLRANLPRFFWLFTAGFVVLLGAFWALALFGIGVGAIAAIMVAATVLAYAAFGLLSVTGELDDWFVAGRQVPPLFNGMGKATGWFSGTVFIVLAGALVPGGQNWLAFLVGWSGGLLLMALLIAPYLRKTGSYTVPEFIGTRYGGGLTRLIAMAVVVVVAFMVTAAQLGFTGMVVEQMLGLPYQAGVWLGLLALLCCTVPGGMRSATWVQVAQYVVLFVAFFVPLVWFLSEGHGDFPQFSETDLAGPGAVGAAAPAGDGAIVDGATVDGTTGGVALDAWRFIALMLCLMAGAAVMPHMLIRSFSASSARGAGRSVAWCLLFVLAIAVMAPGLAALANVEVLDPGLPGTLAGQPFEQASGLDWVKRWGDLGALRIEDLNGDGTLQPEEIAVGPVAISLPMAGLPTVLFGLVAAGAVAAALSTAVVSLLAMATAIGHDVNHAMLAPAASARNRLGTARVLLLVLGVLAAWVAAQRLTEPLLTLAWAASFAASGLFFPLVAAVWWRRATRAGAISGMAFGFAAGVVYAYLVQSGGMEPWLGLDAGRFGIVGMGVSLIALVAVSLMTPAPDAGTRLLVENIRRPYGAPLLPRM